GFLDRGSVFFVGNVSNRPVHFFGTMGAIGFLIGLLITFWLLAKKIISISSNSPYRDVADHPLFYQSLVAIVVGFQLFLTGFVAEMVSRNSAERNNYHIEKVI